MEVSDDLIHHVSKLARIKMTKEEVEHLRKDLISILSAFSRLDRLDTDNVTPSFHPIGLRNVMREDIPNECLSNDLALSNTSHKKDSYFKGPKII